MIVCVAGNPSIDKLFTVERLEFGAIHRPVAFLQVPGGKGLNVARAAHALGAEVVPACILGGHTGRWVEEALEAEGLRGRFVRARGETRSSVSVADRETWSLTEFYEDGTPLEPGDWEALEACVVELLPGARWVTLSGSLPPGAPVDGYARLVLAAPAAGVACALDARGPALAEGLRAGPDLVKVNAAEAGEVLGTTVATEADALAAARELRALAGGRGAAVVTRGEEGAVLVAPDGSAWRGRLYVRGPYPVGSGDAFLAGMVAALERGEDWPAALRLGLGAAAANAEVPGAGRLERARAEELAARAEVGPVASG
ncbi:MAG TPA: hexose kinase [Actinomycetota bacterium]|nr:hexose kinase [Actinomycetota bacterium]